MILLRLLSFLFVPALYVFSFLVFLMGQATSFLQEEPMMEGEDVLFDALFFLVVFALSSGYLLVAFLGPRIAHRQWLRLTTGLLLLLPIALTAASFTHPEVVPLTGPVLAFTVVLFLVYIWPAGAGNNGSAGT